MEFRKRAKSGAKLIKSVHRKDEKRVLEDLKLGIEIKEISTKCPSQEEAYMTWGVTLRAPCWTTKTEMPELFILDFSKNNFIGIQNENQLVERGSGRNLVLPLGARR